MAKNSHSLNPLSGSLIMMGLQGEALLSDERKFIVENDLAGVILFARNCKSPEQLWNLTKELEAVSELTPSRLPFLVGIDMEGGRVQRLPPPFTQWAPMATLGEIDNSPLTYEFALNMGQELRAFGINLNFAPCVDVLTQKNNPAIGDRSFGSDPELVARHGSSVVRGFTKAGVFSCAKHFPGHGNTLVDSHFELPMDSTTSLAELQRIELIPFARVIKTRCDFIMPGHLLFSQIDSQLPASLSSIFLNYLKAELKFRGLLVTDDLDMKALTKIYSREEIAVRALEAGHNLLLYCNDPESPQAGIAGIQQALEIKRLNQEELQLRSDRLKTFRKERVLKSAPADFYSLPRALDVLKSPKSEALKKIIKR